MSLFNSDQFKSAIRFQKELPGYYVDREGTILSTKRGKHQIKAQRTKYQKLEGANYGNGKTTSLVCLQTDFSIPKDLFDDYDYSNRSRGKGKTFKTGKVSKITIAVHRLVAETWMPIDDFPPETLADDWNRVITPDMVGQPLMQENMKQWVRDTAVVDHRDADPTNNHVENLRWVTPKENNSHRKEQQLNLFDNEEI